MKREDSIDYFPGHPTTILTIADLARFLTPNRSEKAIYVMIRLGELPPPRNARHRGRANYWLKPDVNDFLARRCPKP